ncbi:hypothetical protein CN692_06120 [Bacillus sp. AFS002410]|uniref:hypothetical protein n=1 Tax=Bacillus sp. AFS002410 TaxID=2033481 RepID=UPI000BF0645D|nr:hypothetical protein [Bacillus sp. AFS002410]PEJ59052.1 hypothetical protein CN692_06120 [Bacillus sp. AFS002410]
MIKNDGIKPSRKYATGTIHETASGKFKVLDRYLQDGVIMIKLQWLKSDIIEENKEVNVSASIYKFQKNNGVNDNTALSQPLEVQLLHDIKSSLDQLFEVLDLRTELLNHALEKIDENRSKIDENRETLKSQQKMIEEQNRRINTIVDKLIEKM